MDSKKNPPVIHPVTLLAHGFAKDPGQGEELKSWNSTEVFYALSLGRDAG